jgi:hypothetical protein
MLLFYGRCIYHGQADRIGHSRNMASECLRARSIPSCPCGYILSCCDVSFSSLLVPLPCASSLLKFVHFLLRAPSYLYA